MPKSGRPRKLTKAAARYIVLKSKSNPTFTARMVITRCGASHLVKIDAVKRILRRSRLYGKIAIKKPFLTKKHRQSRLRWCKERAGWNAINWGRVIFSDESKIELFPQREIYVRRNLGKALSPSMINSTRKFSPSIMIWGAIRNDGKKILYRCPPSVNQLTYKTILNETLPKIYTTRQLFQHDGAKCHTAESVRVYLEEKQVRVLKNWPAQSPDLSIIEQVWDLLNERVHRRSPKNLSELWTAISEEWELITAQEIQKLYDSIPQGIASVLKSNGGNTKY